MSVGHFKIGKIKAWCNRATNQRIRVFNGWFTTKPNARWNNGLKNFAESRYYPFQIPQSGLEVLWNHLVRYRGDSVKRYYAQAVPQASAATAWAGCSWPSSNATTPAEMGMSTPSICARCTTVRAL